MRELFYLLPRNNSLHLIYTVVMLESANSVAFFGGFLVISNALTIDIYYFSPF